MYRTLLSGATFGFSPRRHIGVIERSVQKDRADPEFSERRVMFPVSVLAAKADHRPRRHCYGFLSTNDYEPSSHHSSAQPW